MRKRNTLLKILLPLIVITIGWGACFQPAQAIWHNLLMEHFMGTPITWYNMNGWGNWDIYPPYPAGPPYSWGITSYVFYNNGIDTQSLWCVGAPNTLDPEQDPYPRDVNSWVKWGPMDLSTAVAARASFWYWCESQPYADYFRWGAYPSNQFNMYEFYRFSGPGAQWTYAYVDFDSLESGSVSLLGESNVYLEFQFYANGDFVVDRGAFIDEVAIAWDDGIFDLAAQEAALADLDSNDITDVFEGDTVLFKLLWSAAGSGTTPMFDIACALDGEPFYSERRNAEIGSSQQIWVETYSEPWVVTPDSHTVAWLLDVRDEIPEASEENNDTSMTFLPMEPNIPPWINILRPTWGDTAHNEFWITWEDEDPNDNARITLYWDQDSLGYNGIIIPGAIDILEDDPADSFRWDVAFMLEGPVWVLALIEDDYDYMWDYSDGPLVIDHTPSYCGEPGSAGLPAAFTLESIYPNPFNSSAQIRFGLPGGENIEVKIFDSMGRLCAAPFEGWLPAGYHEISWSPGDLPSGIYLIELSSPEMRQRAKAVFLK